jgi:hypothetical protein
MKYFLVKIYKSYCSKNDEFSSEMNLYNIETTLMNLIYEFQNPGSRFIVESKLFANFIPLTFGNFDSSKIKFPDNFEYQDEDHWSFCDYNFWPALDYFREKRRCPVENNLKYVLWRRSCQ